MTAHNLNAYKWNHQWVTFCKLCGLEGDDLEGKHCTGKVEPVIKSLKGVDSWFDDDGRQHLFKNGVDKSDIDAYGYYWFTQVRDLKF